MERRDRLFRPFSGSRSLWTFFRFQSQWRRLPVAVSDRNHFDDTGAGHRSDRSDQRAQGCTIMVMRLASTVFWVFSDSGHRNVHAAKYHVYQ